MEIDSKGTHVTSMEISVKKVCTLIGRPCWSPVTRDSLHRASGAQGVVLGAPSTGSKVKDYFSEKTMRDDRVANDTRQFTSSLGCARSGLRRAEYR
ncbi:hypothetical protein Sjap_025960 [Stephania japonica]|uniref:Uncharacterized protein n=1 Tax=Stephania japonica TaxID=461633 RepID=A0AAP0E2Q7_9MAGN